MNRLSNRFTNSVVTGLAALAFAIIVGFAAYFLSNQSSFQAAAQGSPSQVEANIRSSIDLGAGYRLETDGTQGKIVAPPALPARPSTQRFDLGGGHWLETNGVNGKIVAPEAAPSRAHSRVVAPVAPAAAPGRAHSRIVAPAAPAAPPARVTTQRIDLGAGYWLETNGANGRIVAPPAAKEPASPAGSETSKNFGGSYALDMLRKQGQNIPADARAVDEKAPAQQMQDLGSGFWLVDGKIVEGRYR